MTIPIARLVATATRTRRRRCASVISPTPTGGVAPARPVARVPAGRRRADRRARRRTGPPRCSRSCVMRCDAAGLENFRVGLGDVDALSGAARVARRAARRTASGSSPSSPPATSSGSSASSPTLRLSDGDAELLLRVPRMRGGPEVLEQRDRPAAASAGPGMRAVHRAARAEPSAERVIFDFGLVRSLGYYTGAVFQVYDPALRRADRRRRPLRRPARALRPADARGRLRAGVERLHIALTGRGARPWLQSELRRAADRGAARRAVRRETLDLLDRARPRHRRGARERPQAAVRGRRDRHDAPLRRAHLRRGGRRRPRHHRQGRAVGAARARGLRAASISATDGA